MKTVNSQNLKEHLLRFRTNPGKIQQYMLNVLEQLNDGELRIIDATNPAVFCLESAAVLASANMVDTESKLRRQYPAMAVTREELYLHMSDIDYLGIFSNPSKTKLSFIMDLDEVFKRAVTDPKEPRIRKLTIPRYTKVTVAEVDLMLLYPIDIKVLPHGGIKISFDNSEKNPIANIDNNLLDWYVDIIDNIRFLKIEAPFYQVNINRYNISLNAASGFVKEYTFSDYFYYIRAFIPEGNHWKEIRTTHNDLVYNQELPTVVVKVLNNKLKLSIPQIYFDNGKITDTVKIDIYTTKGELDINLSNYSLENYHYDLAPLDNNQQTIFSAPFNTFNRFGFISDKIISGGSGPISFEKLKFNVTTRNAYTENLPISEKQLIRNFEQMGYALTKTIDNITDRQYLATRSLPIPQNKFIVTNLPMNVSVLETSFNKLKNTVNVTSSTYRITLKSGCLFSLKNGILSMVDNDTVLNMKLRSKTNPNFTVNWLNTNTILYNPYYYVFDTRHSDSVPRIYNFDNPLIKSRYFVQENASLELSLGIENYSIYNNDNKNGYVLEVKLTVGETIKELGPNFIDVQLSYLGKNSLERLYIHGKLVSKIDHTTSKPINDIYIYRFNIETYYDVDSEDGLILTPYKNPISLIHEFDIVTIIKDFMPVGDDIQKSEIDDIVKLSLIKDYKEGMVVFGATHNKVVIEFGQRLKHLWNRSRTVVDAAQYDYWDNDVPAVYTENQYRLDANGNVALTYDTKNNNIKTELLHAKGDLIYDATGELVYKHRKGDPKLDSFGRPIFKNKGDGLIRQLDLFLMDAMFYFGNTDDVISYTKHCTSLVTQWVTLDMPMIYNQLLDRTELFYHPPVTLGTVKCVVDNDIETFVESKQSIDVTVYLTEINMNNTSLRESLFKQIVETIQNTLARKTVSVDLILQQLRLRIGDSVVSFVVKGFLKDMYSTITLADTTKTLTLGKKAILLPNLNIDISDDIDVEFKVHTD